MKISKSKSILITLAVLVLVIIAVFVLHYLQARSNENRIKQQFSVLNIGPENEVYGSTFNNKGTEASPHIYDYTNYYWIATRFYNFKYNSVDSGVGKILDTISGNRYTPVGFHANENPRLQLFTFRQGNEYNMVQYVSADKKVHLDLYCFLETIGNAPFSQNNSPGYINEQIFNDITANLTRYKGGLVCGYIASD